MDDENQLCNYVISYLQLSAETIWTSVVQYILHNMGECTEFSKNFDFMKAITLDRCTSILKGPRVKFDELSICILSQALRLHICIFLFKNVWLSFTELSI